MFISERFTGALLSWIALHVHILEMSDESYRLNNVRYNAALDTTVALLIPAVVRAMAVM